MCSKVIFTWPMPAVQLFSCSCLSASTSGSVARLHYLGVVSLCLPIKPIYIYIDIDIDIEMYEDMYIYMYLYIQPPSLSLSLSLSLFLYLSLSLSLPLKGRTNHWICGQKRCWNCAAELPPWESALRRSGSINVHFLERKFLVCPHMPTTRRPSCKGVPL